MSLARDNAAVDDNATQRIAQLLDYKSSTLAGTSKPHYTPAPPLIDISTEDIADVTYIDTTSESDIEFIDDEKPTRSSRQSKSRAISRRRSKRHD